MKKKTFDCVEMMHKGGAQVYELVKDLTEDQELQFWKEQAAFFQRQRERKRRKQKVA